MQNSCLVEIAIPWPFRDKVSMNTGWKWISFQTITRHWGDSGWQWATVTGVGETPLLLYSEQIPLFPPLILMKCGKGVNRIGLTNSPPLMGISRP